MFVNFVKSYNNVAENLVVLQSYTVSYLDKRPFISMLCRVPITISNCFIQLNRKDLYKQ